MPTTLDRYHGALLGLAAGDALGTTLEFTPRHAVTPIADMVGGGPFGLRAGEWTDDTSMAMCLAESLVERGFDPPDQMQRYVRWWQDGYWSSTGRCFDIGNTVSSALRRFQQSGDPFAGSTDRHSAGNGALMRLAPVPLRYAHQPAKAVRLSAEGTRTTHGAAEAVDAGGPAWGARRRPGRTDMHSSSGSDSCDQPCQAASLYSQHADSMASGS